MLMSSVLDPGYANDGAMWYGRYLPSATFVSLVSFAHVVLIWWMLQGSTTLPPNVDYMSIKGVIIPNSQVEQDILEPVQPRPKPQAEIKPLPPPPEEVITQVKESPVEIDVPEPDPEPVPVQEIAREPVKEVMQEELIEPIEEVIEKSVNEPKASAPTPIAEPRSDAAHLNNPLPVYPRLSQRRNEQGTVLVEVFILADGSVGEVRLKQSSGYKRLDRSALKAVNNWRYIPAKQGEKAIDYWYKQPVVFTLK